MKTTLLLLSCIFMVPAFQMQGQSVEKELRRVATVYEANQFAKNNRRLGAEVKEITADDSVSTIEQKLLGRRQGTILKVGNELFKVLESADVHYFRVSNVFLNGRILSKKSIDSVRTTIITRYKNGSSFADLVRIYNMDSNPRGDVGWFSEGMMVPEFEQAVRAHRKDDIFTVDVPDQSWYYVTLKTHNDRKVRKVTYLRVSQR